MKNDLFVSGTGTTVAENVAEDRVVDLSDPRQRARLASKIKADIDAACVEMYRDGHRKHLGGSLIGDPCARKLWSVFRWLKEEQFDGRMYRLFNRGHREEERFVSWLRAIGCDVQEFDTATDGEQTQIRISGVKGHFGGSLDGRLRLPEKYGVPGQIMLAEFKTSGKTAFGKLRYNGVQMEKPLHFAQMSVYGYTYGYQYAIYLCIEKDTDELYVEVVELDWGLGETMYKKADEIINSQIPPPKISQTKTHFSCKWCHFSPICHDGETPEKNCRSCVHAVPIEDKQWGCNKYQSIIPDDFIAKGCDNWEPITK